MTDAPAGSSVDPNAPIEATLVVRRKAEPPAEAFTGPPLTSQELTDRYGADPADFDLVRQTLEGSGVTVVSTDAASRRVRVSGTADTLATLFGTSFTSAMPPGSSTPVRQRTGMLSVPTPLADVVTGVLGLDDRPQARAQFRIAHATAGAVSYTPLDLAAIYQLPDGDGTGQTIAIIELGGGYQPKDLDTYFSGLGLGTPTVTDAGVDGGTNGGGKDPNGADGEVLLDIEVAGAIAPKAALVVYFAPNTDAGFLDAVSEAAHATPTPTAISISWGGPEDSWTAQARDAMDQAFADAALLGATVTAAAGDSGSGDGATDGALHVDFPASSPHALACGGTSLHASGGTVSSESVWNDGSSGGSTGGGISTAFPLPSWQATAGVPTAGSGGGRAGGAAGGGSAAASGGRGVPDVAADADPQTGYQVLIDGQQTVIGGTSAVAPLWAGLICRLAQASSKKLGLLQPTLYAGVTAGAVAKGFRDVTAGNNGAYQAAAGWDACTGLGVPDGPALLALFTG
ncbi:MAG: S53 family peptidase [Nakamurella sp.]